MSIQKPTDEGGKIIASLVSQSKVLSNDDLQQLILELSKEAAKREGKDNSEGISTMNL